MKHVLFVLGSYYPEPSANGVCVKNIIEELNDQYNISILSLGILDGSLKKVEKNNLFFYKTRNMKRNKFNKAKKIVNMITSSKTIDKDLVENQFKNICKINEENSIDVIIPVSLPFESLLSSVKFQKEIKDCEIIPYIFDPFSDNHVLHRLDILKKMRLKKHILLEKEMISKINDMVLINHLKGSNIDDLACGLKKNVHYTEHPLLKLKTKPVDLANVNKAPTLVYGGAFYKGIRNPENMLELFSTLFKEIDLKIKFYSFGDCEDLISKYIEKNSGVIKKYGKVDREIIEKEYNKASFLISIGNTINNQTPSKVIEYISFGKPIIHFAKNLEDPIIELLKVYPVSLIIQEYNMNLECEKKRLKKFIEENKDVNIDRKKIMELYHNASPSHSAEIFSNIINK